MDAPGPGARPRCVAPAVTLGPRPPADGSGREAQGEVGAVTGRGLLERQGSGSSGLGVDVVFGVGDVLSVPSNRSLIDEERALGLFRRDDARGLVRSSMSTRTRPP